MKTRSVELFLAFSLTLVGAILVLSGNTLSLTYLDVLNEWVRTFPGNELAFGVILTVAGLARTAAILINGYWRPTPLIRIVGCLVGSLLWSSITLSVSIAVVRSGGPLPVLLAFTGSAIAFEWFSIICATVDAHKYDSLRLRKWGRSRGDARRYA